MLIHFIFNTLGYLIITSLHLGLKVLTTASLNLKRLVQNTSPKEPILIIISPGTDPSQVR